MKTKICITLIAVTLMLSKEMSAQSNKQSATQRQDKITANWYDRAIISNSAKAVKGKYMLWFDSPAKIWEAAVPLGNGKLGAMVFGGVQDERIQLNESTLWDGYPLDPNNPNSLNVLPEVRRLLFENKNNEAVALATKNMLGNPVGVKPYQSLGELWFDTPDQSVSNYSRTLNLSTAIAETNYTSNGANISREVFISQPENVLVLKFTSNRKNSISFNLNLRREENATCKVDEKDPLILVLSGKLPIKDKEGKPVGLSFASKVKAITKDGKVSIENGVLKVLGATNVTLYVAGATNYPGLLNISKGIYQINRDPKLVCDSILNSVIKKSYRSIKTEHIKAYQKYFNRVNLNLGSTPEALAQMPIDKRLVHLQQTGEQDPGLLETYFQFGRYLLISCSQPGGMPANLQGMWAWQMKPPWNADFHTNINVQMNYWPAEITNLSEMHTPLFELEKALVKPGERTAKTLYGARGWVVHHLTDAWGYTAPADGPQGIWPMGAAWLTRDLWEHYTYNGDKNFLSQTGYPLMKGAAEFILDFLVEAPTGTPLAGKLVTNPSYSPENQFLLSDGKTAVFTYAATMDLEIIRDLLDHCIAATKLLNIDVDFRKKCELTLEKLAPVRISEKTGRIMEWVEDYKETDPHHRHTSHLYALYPGNQITVQGTPQFAEAARKTLEARGDGGTGWSLAWKINMWNRLLDGDHAYKLLTVLLGTKTLPNLFDNHPPFQIDGNFGATAAIAEMFLQSHQQYENGDFIVHLLPALPKVIPNGSITGLKARGGFEVNIYWEKGQLVKAKIVSSLGGKLNVRLGEDTVSFDTRPGEIIILNKNLKKK